MGWDVLLLKYFSQHVGFVMIKCANMSLKGIQVRPGELLPGGVLWKVWGPAILPGENQNEGVHVGV